MTDSGEEGWWTHQWFTRRNPITVYYGDVLVAEYEGRFKLLRARLRMLGKKPSPERSNRWK